MQHDSITNHYGLLLVIEEVENVEHSGYKKVKSNQ